MAFNSRRQWFVPLCIGALILLVGGGSVAFALFDTPSSKEPYPTRPSTLTNETVREYVTDYEEVHLHDEIDQRGAETDSHCNAAIDIQSESDFYVLTTCEASSDRGSSVLDLPHVTTMYLVNETATERIGKFGTTNVRTYQRDRISNDVGGETDESADSSAASLRIYNFDSTSANVTVEITRLNSSATSTTSLKYTIPPTRGVVETDYTVRRGTYRVKVISDVGEAKTRSWNIEEAPSQELIIYVTPAGNVAISTVDNREN